MSAVAVRQIEDGSLVVTDPRFAAPTAPPSGAARRWFAAFLPGVSICLLMLSLLTEARQLERDTGRPSGTS